MDLCIYIYILAFLFDNFYLKSNSVPFMGSDFGQKFLRSGLSRFCVASETLNCFYFFIFIFLFQSSRSIKFKPRHNFQSQIIKLIFTMCLNINYVSFIVVSAPFRNQNYLVSFNNFIDQSVLFKYESIDEKSLKITKYYPKNRTYFATWVGRCFG